MKVFVAGASGAVGRRMIPRLLAAGHAVVAMPRDRAKDESLERAGADAVVCDVFDGPGLTAAVRSAAPSAIIHQLTDLPAAKRVPVLLARLVLGKSLTEWITTMRGASNPAAVSALGWKPRFPSWREGFAASLSAQG